jgi:hypothetical protein
LDCWHLIGLIAPIPKLIFNIQSPEQYCKRICRQSSAESLKYRYGISKHFDFRGQVKYVD